MPLKENCRLISPQSSSTKFLHRVLADKITSIWNNPLLSYNPRNLQPKGGKQWFCVLETVPIWWLFYDIVHRLVLREHFPKAKPFENSLVLVSCLSTDQQQSKVLRFHYFQLTYFIAFLSLTIRDKITRTILGLRHRWQPRHMLLLEGQAKASKQINTPTVGSRR